MVFATSVMNMLKQVFLFSKITVYYENSGPFKTCLPSIDEYSSLLFNFTISCSYIGSSKTTVFVIETVYQIITYIKFDEG